MNNDERSNSIGDKIAAFFKNIAAKLPTGKKLITIIAIAAVILAAIIALCIKNCGSGVGYTVSDGTEIIVLTANSNLKDQSANQLVWDAVCSFSDVRGLSCDNIPVDNYDPTRIADAIDIANAMRANVIVTIGPYYNQPVYDNIDRFPAITFIMIDGKPIGESGEISTANNYYSIDYDEIEGGYLAGYCAVADGYRKLAYVGGMDVNPACVGYGYGFLQGVDAAAADLGVTDQVEVKYWYTGRYSPDVSISDKVTQWYNSGTEVVFTSGGVHISVNSAAESTGNMFIGADANLYEQTEWYSVLTSAEKPLYKDTMDILTMLYGNGRKLPKKYAGVITEKGIADGGMILSTAPVQFETTSSDTSWFFKNLTPDQYSEIVREIRSGRLAISKETRSFPKVSVTVTVEE